MSSSPDSNSAYDDNFFAYNEKLARVSADVVISVVLDLLPDIASVVDFGCAEGVWLRCWLDHGVDDVRGVDDKYVDQSNLAIPPELFRAWDLNEPIDLGRRFDLACCLEVAEHLRPESSESLVRSLTRHADMVLFSAAPPGQGGESHINESPFESWRTLFRAQGYSPYDCVRPQIAHRKAIPFWYRYNIVLYVRDDLGEPLPQVIRTTEIGEGRSIPDISPPVFKLRKLAVRLLPKEMQNALARFKAAVVGRRN